MWKAEEKAYVYASIVSNMAVIIYEWKLATSYSWVLLYGAKITLASVAVNVRANMSSSLRGQLIPVSRMLFLLMHTLGYQDISRNHFLRHFNNPHTDKSIWACKCPVIRPAISSVFVTCTHMRTQNLCAKSSESTLGSVPTSTFSLSNLFSLKVWQGVKMMINKKQKCKLLFWVSLHPRGGQIELSFSLLVCQQMVGWWVYAIIFHLLSLGGGTLNDPLRKSLCIAHRLSAKYMDKKLYLEAKAWFNLWISLGHWNHITKFMTWLPITFNISSVGPWLLHGGTECPQFNLERLPLYWTKATCKIYS